MAHSIEGMKRAGAIRATAVGCALRPESGLFIPAAAGVWVTSVALTDDKVTTDVRDYAKGTRVSKWLGAAVAPVIALGIVVALYRPSTGTLILLLAVGAIAGLVLAVLIRRD